MKYKDNVNVKIRCSYLGITMCPGIVNWLPLEFKYWQIYNVYAREMNVPILRWFHDSKNIEVISVITYELQNH